MKRRLLPVVVLLLLARSGALAAAENLSAASEPARFEQILVPFDTGEYVGSIIWRAELWVRNDSSEVANLFPETCHFLGRPFPCDRRIEVASKSTVLLDVLASTPLLSPGALLYVPEGEVSNLHFNLRVRAQSSSSAGTEIPIVRSKDYRTGRSNLLNVPIDSRFRRTLRAYLPNLVWGRFTVRIFRTSVQASGESLVAERSFDVSFPTDPPLPLLVPGMVDLSGVFNEITGADGDTVRVEIEPSLPVGARYWPLLTITNNATREITVVTAP